MTTPKDGEKSSMEAQTSFSVEPAKEEDQLVVPTKPPPEDANLPVLAKTQATRLTREEAVQAAKECGLGALDVGRWEGYGKVGQYLQELGAVKVATGQFVYTNRHRRHVMQICRRAMGKCENPEHVAKLAEAINKSLDSSDAAIRELLKFVHTGVIKEPSETPQFQLPPRGTPVVAVQVNNRVVDDKDR